MRTVFKCRRCGLLTAGRLTRRGRETGEYAPCRHRGDGTVRRRGRTPLCSGALELADYVDVDDDVRVFGDAREQEGS